MKDIIICIDDNLHVVNTEVLAEDNIVKAVTTGSALSLTVNTKLAISAIGLGKLRKKLAYTTNDIFEIKKCIMEHFVRVLKSDHTDYCERENEVSVKDYLSNCDVKL